MSTNITIDVLAREFDEANEKFKALSISDFGNHVDKQKMMQELQKVKFVAEAALENCKSSDFNDNNDSSAEHEENIIITLNALELYLEKLNVVNNFVSSEMGEVSSDDFNDEEQRTERCRQWPLFIWWWWWSADYRLLQFYFSYL